MIKKKQEIIKSFKQYAVEGINRKTTIERHKKRFKLKSILELLKLSIDIKS